MDIASISMAMAQSQLSTNVGIAVLDNAMETSEALGEGLIELVNSSAMELSVNPTTGSNIDIRI